MEKLVYFKSGVIISALVFAAITFSPINIQDRLVYAVDNPSDYFSEPSESVKFSQSQVDLLNDVNERSIGLDVEANERLYCMVYDGSENRVEQLELVDEFIGSSRFSVEGSCGSLEAGGVNAWLHTQPRFSEELSSTDKDVSRSVDLMCIHYGEIVESSSGKLQGINCWEVDRVPNEEDDFVEKDVVLSGS